MNTLFLRVALPLGAWEEACLEDLHRKAIWNRLSVSVNAQGTEGLVKLSYATEVPPTIPEGVTVLQILTLEEARLTLLGVEYQPPI